MINTHSSAEWVFLYIIMYICFCKRVKNFFAKTTEKIKNHLSTIYRTKKINGVFNQYLVSLIGIKSKIYEEHAERLKDRKKEIKKLKKSVDKGEGV